jgi:hypothetical protein
MTLPKPYLERDGITLYHGDAREILPLIEADAIVTDPVWPNATVPLFGSEDPLGMFVAMWAALPSLPKRAAIQLGCDSDPRFLAAVPEALPFFRVAWLEIVRMGYKGRLGMTGDVGYLFGEPPPSRPGQRVIPGRMIDADSRGQQNAHPCPRKIAHVQWLVKWWTALDDVVLDPFAGSGTTLEAAREAGRRAIGIEIEERYCEIVAKRLSQKIVYEMNQ